MDLIDFNKVEFFSSESVLLNIVDDVHGQRRLLTFGLTFSEFVVIVNVIVQCSLHFYSLWSQPFKQFLGPRKEERRDGRRDPYNRTRIEEFIPHHLKISSIRLLL